MTPNPVSILLIGAMVAQVILGTENQAEKNAYTFLIPGKSYLEYHINWSEVHEIQLEMTFRTLVTKTMLLHHTFLEVEGEYRPELKVMLNKGVLDVEHRYGDVVERLAIAKGLAYLMRDVTISAKRVVHYHLLVPQVFTGSVTFSNTRLGLEPTANILHVSCRRVTLTA
ncbi:hypothetical protein LSH36_28g04060 [Paralvinella palmiformis]|uniref:Uncharacterized protein n=1 Tax=Paralvinella palmiformis TaxID=53620 RepID=A0AAD9NEL1_9ANNE|nr:hypothetical protein LSH36_28g04060 [Paralvinella palmiformis]